MPIWSGAPAAKRTALREIRLNIALLVIGILGFIVTVFFGYLAARLLQKLTQGRNSSPESSCVDPLGHWHAKMFYQPLEYLDKHITNLNTVPEQTETPDRVKRVDLLDWGTGLLLTAASVISPFSQGKANLFVVSSTDANGQMLKIRSKTLVGPFPLTQLVDLPDMIYRDMPVPQPSIGQPQAFAVAVQALHVGQPLLQPIEKAEYASFTEKALGTTHILGIPLRSPHSRVKVGDVAVMTVDFRFSQPWYRKFLPRGPWHRQENAVIGRAKLIQSKARQLYGLQ